MATLTLLWRHMNIISCMPAIENAVNLPRYNQRDDVGRTHVRQLEKFWE